METDDVRAGRVRPLDPELRRDPDSTARDLKASDNTCHQRARDTEDSKQCRQPAARRNRLLRSSDKTWKCVRHRQLGRIKLRAAAAPQV